MKAHLKLFTREVYSIVAEWNNPDTVIDVPESDLKRWQKTIDEYRWVQGEIRKAVSESDTGMCKWK